MTVSFFTKTNDQKLAYVCSPAEKIGANLPTIMFLGGFKSDMSGTKATYLEQQAKARGQGFVRFDYTGHGQSDGAFKDGTIGAWADDAADILKSVVTGDVILVGSSMGGWISLLLSLNIPQRIKGMVLIAPAPDFTREIEEKLTHAQKKIIETKGYIEIPSDYADQPYVITRALLADGRNQCLLHKKYDLNIPVTIVQGKKDTDVPWQKALKIQECFGEAQTKVIFINDGDHRLSREEDLILIDSEIQKLL